MTVRESSDSNESLPDPSDGAVAGSAADPPVNPDSHESEGTGADPTEETRSFGSSVRQALKWSFVNTGGAKIIGLMSGVILARLLTPHDYGLFAIAFLALNLANSLNDAGLQQAITRWPGDIDGVAPTAVTVCLSVSLVCYGLLFVLAPSICTALGAPKAAGMIRVLSLILVLSGFDSVPAAVLSRNFRQDRQAIADLVSSASVGLTILLAYLGYGAWSFVWGQLTGNLIGTALIVWFAPVRYRPGFNRAAFRQLMPQGLPLAGSAIVSIGVLNVDYITVARLLGPAALGFYVFAYNISSWPLNLSVAVRRVSLPAFAKLQYEPEALNSGFVRSMAMLTSASVPICVLIAALASPLVTLVYGDRWLPAAAPLRYLAIFAIIRIVLGLGYDAIVATGRARASLWLQAAWLVLLIPAIIAGTRLAGITGTAVAQVVVGLIFVAPLHLFVLRRTGIRLRPLGRHLLWPCVAGALGGSVAYFSTYAVDGSLQKLALGGSLGLLTCALALLPVRGLLAEKPAATD